MAGGECFVQTLSAATSGRPLYVSAPMVRYSKLPFRQLVRKYGVDICFTPMIMADSFVRSGAARNVEFTTCADDHPLIVQFAARTPGDFASAAEAVCPFVEGVDLNCGCPQRWAMAEGYGSKMISNPELIADIVKQTRSRIDKADFCISIKIRIHDDLRKTVDLCQQAERAGISLLSVHARTPAERTQPVHRDAFSVICSAVSVPVFANGDVTARAQADELAKETGVSGVMSARGLLNNPALFASHDLTPLDCVKDFLDISLSHGVLFTQFHHHLMYMMDAHLPRCQKQVFNRLQSVPAVLDFLEEHYGL